MNRLLRISRSIGTHFRIWLPLSLATATLIALIGPYADLSAQFGDAILFDTHPVSTPSDATARLITLGPNGIHLYQLGLLLDLVFSAANAILLILLLHPASSPSIRPQFRYLLLLPLLAFATDLVENLFVASYFSHSISTTAITLGHLSTHLKFAAFLAATISGILLRIGAIAMPRSRLIYAPTSEGLS